MVMEALGDAEERRTVGLLVKRGCLLVTSACQIQADLSKVCDLPLCRSEFHTKEWNSVRIVCLRNLLSGHHWTTLSANL